MSRNGLHQIRAAAQAVGLPVRALRHYAEIGLVAPSHLRDSGLRAYTDADLERLRLVKQMESLHFTTDEMRSTLEANSRLDGPGHDGSAPAPSPAPHRRPATDHPDRSAEGGRRRAPQTVPSTHGGDAPSGATATSPLEHLPAMLDQASTPTPAELIAEDLDLLWSPQLSAVERATILERLERRAGLIERHCHDLREELDEALELAHRIRRELRRQRAGGRR